MQVSVHANLNVKTLGGHPPTPLPPITSEQIIDDRHGKNPCMLTKIENVAEMPSVAESCPRGGFKVQNFLTCMDEGKFLKRHVIMPARAFSPF